MHDCTLHMSPCSEHISDACLFHLYARIMYSKGMENQIFFSFGEVNIYLLYFWAHHEEIIPNNHMALNINRASMCQEKANTLTKYLYADANTFTCT